MELSVASGAVDGDKGGEDAHQEEDQHHVLREPNVLGGVVMVKGKRRRTTSKNDVMIIVPAGELEEDGDLQRNIHLH